MSTKKFTINTEPHEAELGGKVLRFVPEVEGPELLDAWAELNDDDDVARQDDDVELTTKQIAERAHRNRDKLRGFVRGLLYDDESRTAFDEMKVPDRVLVEVQRWLLEVYGFRPTGSSSDSSSSEEQGSSGTGSSTDGSAEEPTP